MGLEEEFESCVGDLFDSTKTLNSTNLPNNPVPIHFSEYHTKNNTLNENLLTAFEQHMHKPTEEEWEAYRIKCAEEEKRLEERREYDRIHGPAFLSDEWRWAQIDAGKFRDRY
jgi:hypothetical protein